MKRLNLTRVRNADGEGCAGGTTTTVDADADADAANGTGAGTGPVTCGASTSAAKSLTARLGWQRLTLLPSFLVLVLFVTWLWFRQADLDAISENALSNGQVAKALRQHVELTAISTFFVLVIAIPLGVLLTRRAFRRATPVAMAVANIGQAAPAIGLLALLVIWLGIGRKAALIGIVAYAVLPVLSNTIAGLKANDPTLLEAARGIGMSSTGVLARVELPLAVPLILAGVRTALVLNVGTATLAAFGGGGGLGVLITTGITNQRMPVLMLGSVLTVVLALLVDWLASLAELLWRPRVGGGDMRQGCAFLAGSLLLAALVPACGLTSGSPMVDDVEPGSIGKGKPLSGAELTVTSKSFTENLILGAMMGIAFEAAGAEVLDRTGIQGPFGAREAVRKGDADGMYEYTGTAWITYQGNSEPIADPHAQWRAVRDADLKDGLTWLSPSALNNTYALAMNEANLRKYGTKTLTAVSELSAARPKAVTLCVEGEFANRADGLPGMERTYGMSLPAGNITQVDTGIIYTQAAKGSCVYGEVFTTDGRIKSMNLAVMADDRKFFPNYNAAPEINSKALKKWPAIAEVLDPVTAKLTNAVARELNARVDVEGEDPHQVALDWMKAEGLVK